MLLSDRDYLRLIALSLSKEMMPELVSRGAQATAEIALNALKELIKRDRALPRLLAEFAPGGAALADRLAALLERAGETFDGGPMDALRSALTHQGSDLRTQFSLLLGLLDRNARRLSAARPPDDPNLDADISCWLRDVADWELAYYMAFAAIPDPDIDATVERPRELTREKLESHLRSRLPEWGPIEVRDFTTVPGGYGNETFFFTLHTGDGDEELVVRKNLSPSALSFWAHRAREEFEIVKRVHQAGLPVPKPLWLFKDMPDVDGDYYVVTRGRGRMIGSLGSVSEAVPEELLLNLAEFLARLHSIPLANFADYISVGDTPVAIGDTVEEAVRKNVEYVQRVWSSSAHLASPAEAFIIDWLKRNVPANPNPPVLVHSDCFVHNFLVTGTEITTVVDWEAAHFGDPAEDLAYIRDQVGALMDWRRFLDHYRKCGGQPVEDSSLNYYNCLLNFRNCFGSNVGVARIPAGFSDIRMIPLGSKFLPLFMKSCIDATR